MFLRFTKLNIFPLHITEGMSKHGAANPQSRILGKRVSLKSFSASTLFLLLQSPSNNIFLSGKSQGLRVGERGLTSTQLLSSLWGQVSKSGRYSEESPVWNLYSPFFKDLCFCPTGRVVKSLKFNMWMNKSFRNAGFLNSIIGCQ